MSATMNMEWERELFLPRPPTDIEREAKKRFGSVPPALPYLTGVPWLARVSLEMMLVKPEFLHAEMIPLIFLVVSQDNSCRHCYGTFRALLQVMGFSAREIDGME